MTAALLPFAFEQGATWRRHMTWFQPSPDPTAVPPPRGNPMDLTGCTAEMQLRARPGGILFCAVNTLGGILLGGVAGTVDIVFSAALTTQITAKAGFYDLLITFPNADVVRLLEGPFTNNLAVSV